MFRYQDEGFYMKQSNSTSSNPLKFFRRLADEEGMTLIEILTSMIVFLVVSAGIAGTMIIGLRSTSETQLATMGKAVAQEQIEEIKSRPFYVPFTEDEEVGTTADIDMLDIYFPDTDSGTYTFDGGWEGWYSESNGDAYYTMVSPADDRGMFKTIETRFIDSSGNVILPDSLYDSNGLGYDFPPSYLVEVTVTTTWAAREGEDSFQLVSRVSGIDQTLDDADVPDDNPGDDPGDDDSDDESDDDECDMESYDGESDDSSDDSIDNASGDEDESHDDGENSEDTDSDDTSDDGNSDEGSTDEENCDTESGDGESDETSDEDSADNDSHHDHSHD